MTQPDQPRHGAGTSHAAAGAARAAPPGPGYGSSSTFFARMLRWISFDPA